MKNFDVIVIGGGHAGCEASLASSRLGLNTLMMTMNISQIGAMSCNPAIGGLAKGHLVREIDALGGEMAKCIDKTAIQFRMLNRSKGPAVHGPRAQADRHLYQYEMRQTLQAQDRLTIIQAMAKRLITKGDRVVGVITGTGETIGAKSVILCSGTFLNGLIHVGLNKTPAGRAGEPPAIGITDNLIELGFKVGRLKTGTCPRVERTTIDFSKTETQPGDSDPKQFSFFGEGVKLKQVPCHITHTTEQTQKVIEDNLDRSPLYTGVIEGVGPRYCPSIEDKVKRFPDKRRHQIFLEPEGLTTTDIYPNGLSTSLPVDVQLKFLRTIPGLENVKINRPGYAIEYDFCPPTQIFPTLETKNVGGLFFAGQINGTSGYEEAGAQGLVAGVNSAMQILGEEPLILTRQNSYIGVLIDDLVTKGTEEPYRMFTSRAEFRLLLRQDNADLRLCEVGKRIGLLQDEYYQMFSTKKDLIQTEIKKLKVTRLNPNDVDSSKPEILRGKVPGDGILLSDLLKRPGITVEMLPKYSPAGLAKEVCEQIEITFKYEGYIKRQEKLMQRALLSEHKNFPDDFDFAETPGLSAEVVEKLIRVKPLNLGQAGRISGVTPAALTVLHLYLEKRSLEKKFP